MATATSSVDEWVVRIQKTRNGKDLLRILEQFRHLDWTEKDRQRISHTYMKVLDTILKSCAETLSTSEETESANDGPVWYEKM